VKRGKIEIFAIDNMNNYGISLVSILFHTRLLPFWLFKGFYSNNFLFVLTFGLFLIGYKFRGFSLVEGEFRLSQRESYL